MKTARNMPIAFLVEMELSGILLSFPECRKSSALPWILWSERRSPRRYDPASVNSAFHSSIGVGRPQTLHGTAIYADIGAVKLGSPEKRQSQNGSFLGNQRIWRWFQELPLLQSGRRMGTTVTRDRSER